jgi:hypothetical protein
MRAISRWNWGLVSDSLGRATRAALLSTLVTNVCGKGDPAEKARTDRDEHLGSLGLGGAGLAATEDEIPHEKDPENSRRENDPLQHIQHKELPATRFVHFFRRRWCSVRLADRSPQKQGSRFPPSARGIRGAPPQRPWPRPVGSVVAQAQRTRPGRESRPRPSGGGRLGRMRGTLSFSWPRAT